MNGTTAYALSKSYTDDSLKGIGALKGASCQIQSITDITGGKRVTFLWVDNSEVEHTSTMDVMNGADGKGIKSVTINAEEHLIVTYTDDTTTDVGEIPISYTKKEVDNMISSIEDTFDSEIKETNFKLFNTMKSYTFHPYAFYRGDATQMSINGINHLTRGLMYRYLNTTSGIGQSTSFVSTQRDFYSAGLGLPAKIRVKILDDTLFSEVTVRAGWRDDTNGNVIIFNDYTNDLRDYIFDVPSYPLHENTSSGLMITIGRLKSFDTSTAESLEAMLLAINNAVEITIYYNIVLPNREERNRNVSDDYIYNSEYRYGLKLPYDYHPYELDNKTPLLIFVHGLSGTVGPSQWGSNADMMPLVNKFVNDGYAVMDVRQVTTADWCNPALTKRYVRAINHICANYNVIPTYIFAESMGSMTALVIQRFYNIKAMVIAGCRLDFESRYYMYEEGSEGRSIIDNNLGFTNGFDKNIASGWCNTCVTVLDDDGELVIPTQFPPTLFMIGLNEATPQHITDARRKIAEIKRGGTICDTKDYESNHHDICYLIAGASYNDTIDWFNMWE